MSCIRINVSCVVVQFTDKATGWATEGLGLYPGRDKRVPIGSLALPAPFPKGSTSLTREQSEGPLATHIHLVPRLAMLGALPPLTLSLDGREWSASRSCRFTPRYALNKRLAGPHSRSGRFAEEKNLLPRSGIEPFVSRPAQSAVTTGLSYPSFLLMTHCLINTRQLCPHLCTSIVFNRLVSGTFIQYEFRTCAGNFPVCKTPNSVV